jgi:hypothetical protein
MASLAGPPVHILQTPFPPVILFLIMKVRYWFKAHKSGYGWYPASWQGWLILIAYVVAVVQSFLQLDGVSHSVSDTLINFFPRFLILTAILIVTTYLKGESIVWGEKEKDRHTP